MKINKQQDLNTAYNKAFKFRFYPDSEQVSLLNHFFGSARFVFNQTLNYSINHYQSKEHLITDDYGNLITLGYMTLVLLYYNNLLLTSIMLTLTSLENVKIKVIIMAN